VATPVGRAGPPATETTGRPLPHAVVAACPTSARSSTKSYASSRTGRRLVRAAPKADLPRDSGTAPEVPVGGLEQAAEMRQAGQAPIGRRWPAPTGPPAPGQAGRGGSGRGGGGGSRRPPWCAGLGRPCAAGAVTGDARRRSAPGQVRIARQDTQSPTATNRFKIKLSGGAVGDDHRTRCRGRRCVRP
jgi:hypothetical protein